MIDSFTGDNRFLSNFYECYVSFEGLTYRSVEHAYVAAKTTDPILRLGIQGIDTAGKVKQFGRTIEIRHDWDNVKLAVMETLLREKFAQNYFKNLLLKTDLQELVEGNSWHDRFWGVCRCGTCNNKGENNLGKLLMKIRTELQEPRLFY